MSDGLRSAYWEKVKVPPPANWERDLFETHKIKRVLDIGANYGGFIHAWLGAGAIEVHAIEPVPACYDALVNLYADDTRVRCHRLGIDDAPGAIVNANVFHCWTLLPDQSMHTVNGAPIDRAVDFKTHAPFDVEMTTIDEVLARWQFAPDFIKIDVDGYDARALRGARGYLATRKPILMLELAYHPEFLGDCVECMVKSLYELGYRMRCLNDLNDGKPLETLKDVMRIYPWDTSFDVICEPCA